LAVAEAVLFLHQSMVVMVVLVVEQAQPIFLWVQLALLHQDKVLMAELHLNAVEAAVAEAEAEVLEVMVILQRQALLVMVELVYQLIHLGV
jgi:hypothetical protein